MRNYRRGALLPTLSRIFDEAVQSNFDRASGSLASPFTRTSPLVNIKNNEEDYVVELAAPGMSKEDFTVELEHDVLTIQAEAKEENETTDETGKYTRKEFSYQTFKRSFNLKNELVEEDKITATYKDGVLSVVLPKKEEAKEKPAKTIEISE